MFLCQKFIIRAVGVPLLYIFHLETRKMPFFIMSIIRKRAGAEAPVAVCVRACIINCEAEKEVGLD